MINANGVLITKNGQVNANRFVASTSSIKNEDMTKFANMQKFEDGLSFSPVFKPNKLGNVVNMGNINAKDILIISNKFDNKQGQITSNKLHLVGNEIYLDVEKTNSKDLYLSAYEKAVLMQNGSSFYNQDKLSDFNYNLINYNGESFNNKIIKNYSISNINDWFYFAKGWDENKNNMRSVIDLFSLENDIDFGKDKGNNYANYCIDGLGCTSMIIGHSVDFNKNFDGEGHALKNINIDTTVLDSENKPKYVGIFGKISGGEFKNINIDYMDGSINANGANGAGGFAGDIDNGKFSNINISSINEIYASDGAGGFAGSVSNGKFSNINISDIGKIYATMSAGGFTSSANAEFDHINLYNINLISSINAGGFVGIVQGGRFNYINIENLQKLTGGNGYAGGFAGSVNGGVFSNIALNHINHINALYNAGGFAGSISGGDFDNIVLNGIGKLKGNKSQDYGTGGFAGIISGGDFNGIYVYFDPSATIDGKYEGIFVGSIKNTHPIVFSNINLYYTNNQFTNINNIGTKESSATVSGENEISHSGTTYDDFKTKVLTDLASKGLVEIDCGNDKKCLTFTTQTIQDSTDPDVSDNIALDSDDLYLEGILEYVLKDLAKVYQVNIFDLERLLKDYQALGTNASTKAKAEFIKNHLLVNASLNDAIKIVESLDFILAYDKNGLKDYFAKNPSNSAKDTYNDISEDFAKVSTNKEHIKNTIKELNNQVNQINTASKAYEEEFKALNDLINQYNTIIAKYEESGIITDQIIAVLKGLESQINNSLTKLNTKFLSGVNNNIVSLETIKADNQKDYFKINGSFMKLAKLNVKLAPIPDGSVDPEIPDRPVEPVDPVDPTDPVGSVDPIYPEEVNKPDHMLSSNTLDAQLDDEESIDETSHSKQNLKTCIVSDNYKVMNPCIAGSI